MKYIKLILPILLIISTTCTRAVKDKNEKTSSKKKVVSFSSSSTPLKTSDGVEIFSTYFHPPGTVKKAPVLILLHNLQGNKRNWYTFATTSQRYHFAAICFDFRGHGKSFLEGNYKRHWKDFVQDDYNRMLEDVLAVYQRFYDHKELDSSRIFLVGGGIGANIALKFASINKNIKGVVLLSPGLDYKGIKTAKYIEKYGARPILIVVSDRDKYSLKSSKELSKIGKGKVELKIVKRVGRGTQLLYKNKVLINFIIQWIIKNK